MKRILIVIGSLSGGGGERVASTLASALANKGYDVTVGLTYPEAAVNYSVDNGVKIQNITRWYADFLAKQPNLSLSAKIIRRAIKLTRKVFGEGTTIEFWLEGRYQAKTVAVPLREFIKNSKFDTVISFLTSINVHTVMAVEKLRVKVIVAERTYPANPNITRELVWLRNNYYKKADVCVFQTISQRDYFSKKIRQKSIIIPNPLVSNLPPKKSEKHERVIVSFGRLVPLKNYEMLIQAFAVVHQKHDNYTLVLYGDGESKENLKQLAADLNISEYVSIEPFRTDIHGIVARAGMYVSTSNWEGLSNSMLEAMALGLPVICTDCDGGGARETIRDHENGILIPKGDVYACAAAICELIENPHLAQKLSENAYQIREILSTDKIVEKWEEIL